MPLSLDDMYAVERSLDDVGVTPGYDFQFTDYTNGDFANQGSGTAASIMTELVKSYGFRRDERTGAIGWSFANIGTAFEESPVWTTLDYLLLAVPVAKVGLAAGKVAKGVGAAGRTYGRALQFQERAKKVTSLGEATGLGAEGGAEAVELLAKTEVGRRARAAESVGRMFGTGEGFGAAVELELRHGVPRTAIGGWFASGVARRGMVESFDPQKLEFVRHLDPEWENLIKASGGADPFEQRSLYSIFKREALLEKEMAERTAEDLTRMTNSALENPEVREKFGRMLNDGAEIDDIARELGKDAAYIAERTHDFRLRLHIKGWEMGLFGDDTFEWGLKEYFPRTWGLMEKVAEAKKAAAFRGGKAPGAGRGMGISGREAGRRYRHQRMSQEAAEMLEAKNLMHRALDPAAGYKAMADYASFIASQSFMRRLANSSFVKPAQDLVEGVYDMLKGVPKDEWDTVLKTRFAKTYDPMAVEKITREIEKASRNGHRITAEVSEKLAAEWLGWRKMEDAFKTAGVPNYLKRIPEHMKEMWVDPALARDFAGMSAFTDSLPDIVKSIYMGTMAHFKASKTAYNPATHVRNWFGAIVFHHLTVGGAGPMKTGFRRGYRAIRAGARITDDAEALTDWKELIESGLLGTSFDREIVEAISAALGRNVGDRVTALDWLKLIPKLGQSKVTSKILDTASGSERFYRFTDELAKADAFLERRDYWLKVLKEDPAWKGRTSTSTRLVKHGKKGKAKTEAAEYATRTVGTDELIRLEARARAAQDVVKFQPVFSQNSPLTNLVRNAVPFSSFTTEALRVWKNALVEKPHLAFFYNHGLDAVGQMMGAITGFTPEELNRAKAAMPEYAQGRKALILPWRNDGKPTFLDLSYLVPLGNIAETADVEAGFFDKVMIDPFASNPFLSFAYALKSGKDPFSGQPIEPRLLERQLGMNVPAEGSMRQALGMAEHIVKMGVPPWMPPGYAGMNLWELARGEKHSVSGEELEEGIIRTALANVGGLRTYEADVAAQLLNARRSEKRISDKLKVHWNRWAHSYANGRADRMEESINEIRALREELGEKPDVIEKYIKQGVKRREPGKWRGISTRQLKATLERSRGVVGQGEADKRMYSELMARYQERRAD